MPASQSASKSELKLQTLPNAAHGPTATMNAINVVSGGSVSSGPSSLPPSSARPSAGANTNSSNYHYQPGGGAGSVSSSATPVTVGAATLQSLGLMVTRFGNPVRGGQPTVILHPRTMGPVRPTVAAPPNSMAINRA